MGADAGVRGHEANQMIVDAINLLVQIGIRHETRRVVAISNLLKDLKNGEVFFEPLFRYCEGSTEDKPRWDRLDQTKFPINNDE